MRKANLILPIIIALGGCLAVNSVYADNSTDFSITVNPSVSLTLSSSSVNMQITPTQSGAYDSNSFTVSASTNNTTGYTLVMTTSSPDLVSNTLNFNTNEYPSIPTVAESENGISAADFEASTDSNILNHWGLAVDSGNFNTIKSSQIIKATSTNISNDDTTLTMASKLDLLTAPGVYSTTLNFQMTANPLPDTLETAYDKAQKQKATIGGQDYYAIQDMDSTICADVDVIPSTLKVYDNRDNTVYTIGKLADERCWLLDNLALDLTATNASTNITASNTNASATALEYLFGTTTRDPNTDPDGSYATAGVANWTSSYGYSVPLIDISSKDVLPTTDNSNGKDEPLASTVTSENWKVGVYYNYCAASAGSYCYSNGSSVDKPNTAIDAEYDICPAGWRMPTGDSYDATDRPDGGEYQTLATAYTGNTGGLAGDPSYINFRKALRLPLSGLFDSNTVSIYAQGLQSSFWSSTHSSSYRVYRLSVYTSYFNPRNSSYLIDGYSVRCIAK